MSALAAPAASVADTGNLGGASPTPSDQPLETQVPSPGGDGATADPGAGDGGSQPEAGDHAQGADGKQPDAQGEQPNGDGRVIPAKWRELAKQDPEFRALFFERQQFKKEFPGGLQEVRGLREALELAGGEAGIQQMQADLGDFRKLAEQFFSGDEAYIADLFESDAESAMQHLGHYLDKAEEVGGPAYERVMAKRIHSEHDAVGLRGSLKQAYDAIKAKDPENPALRILNTIAAWHDRVQNVAETEPDPEVERLRKQVRESSRASDDAELQRLSGEYQSATKKLIDAEIETQLTSFLKGRVFPDKAKVLNWILREADSAVGADKEFIKQRDALFQRRDAKASSRLGFARWKKEVARVVPEAIRLFATNAPKAAPQNGGNGQPAAKPSNTGGGFVSVDKVPAVHEIDRMQTTREMTRLHRAVLKNGQKVDYSKALAG
ncbi:MAG: hypothetical protein ACRD8A_12695 [Candidatus Acidiferrales bacterium]